MKKFEYLQVEYSKYPSAEKLNEEGEEGWEFIDIHQYEKRFFDSELATYYTREIYLATFKREMLCQEYLSDNLI